jgi:hypothetical protein
VLCEIYSRIGELKIGQKNKIAKDILKMLLIERMMLRPFDFAQGDDKLKVQHESEMLRQDQHDKMEMPDSAKADKQVRHDKTLEVQEVWHNSTWKFRKIIAFADEEAASSFSGGESSKGLFWDRDYCG